MISRNEDARITGVRVRALIADRVIGAQLHVCNPPEMGYVLVASRDDYLVPLHLSQKLKSYRRFAILMPIIIVKPSTKEYINFVIN